MVVLALVVGVAGGAALTAFAGARRTDSAIDRFLAYSHSTHAFVGTDPSLASRIGRLPQVEDWDEAAYLLMAPVNASGQPDLRDNLGTFAVVRPGGSRVLL